MVKRIEIRRGDIGKLAQIPGAIEQAAQIATPQIVAPQTCPVRQSRAPAGNRSCPTKTPSGAAGQGQAHFFAEFDHFRIVTPGSAIALVAKQFLAEALIPLDFLLPAVARRMRDVDPALDQKMHRPVDSRTVRNSPP